MNIHCALAELEWVDERFKAKHKIYQNFVENLEELFFEDFSEAISGIWRFSLIFLNIEIFLKNYGLFHQTEF